MTSKEDKLKEILQRTRSNGMEIRHGITYENLSAEEQKKFNEIKKEFEKNRDKK